MKKFSIILLVLVVCSGTAYISWRTYLRSNSVTVVFANAQGIQPGAGVWMAGIKIGRVLDLKISRDGVAIVLFLPDEVRHQLTDHALFVIDPSGDGGQPPIIRVKDLSRTGHPLKRNMRLKGVDSLLVWQLSDLQEKVQRIMNDPHVREDLLHLQGGGKN